MNDALVLDNLGLAGKLAGHWCQHPRDYDDIHSDALFGLLQAARRYDPDRGVKFSAYAWPRINGAIIDGIRHRHAPNTYQAKHGNYDQPISLDRPIGDGHRTLGDLLPADGCEDDWIDRLDDRAALDRACSMIDDSRNGRMIRAHLSGRTFADLGRDYDVTESRVCQIWRRWLQTIAA